MEIIRCTHCSRCVKKEQGVWFHAATMLKSCQIAAQNTFWGSPYCDDLRFNNTQFATPQGGM